MPQPEGGPAKEGKRFLYALPSESLRTHLLGISISKSVSCQPFLPVMHIRYDFLPVGTQFPQTGHHLLARPQKLPLPSMSDQSKLSQAPPSTFTFSFFFNYYVDIAHNVREC